MKVLLFCARCFISNTSSRTSSLLCRITTHQRSICHTPFQRELGFLGIGVLSCIALGLLSSFKLPSKRWEKFEQDKPLVSGKKNAMNSVANLSNGVQADWDSKGADRPFCDLDIHRHNVDLEVLHHRNATH